METALSWHLPAFLRALLPGTVLRVLGLGAALVPVGWSLPAPESLVARLAPGGGLVAKLLGVGYAGVAALGILLLFAVLMNNTFRNMALSYAPKKK